jgi:hypothetical protein
MTTTARSVSPPRACCAPSAIAGLVLALTGRSLPPAAWATYAVVCVIGLPERYLALRLRLDATLFEGLAQGSIATLPALDNALERLGFRQAAEAPRPLADRVLGIRQLMQRHSIVAAVQTAVFVMALVLQD